MLSSSPKPPYYYIPAPKNNVNTSSNTRLLPTNFYGASSGGAGRRKPTSSFKREVLSCSFFRSQSFHASFPLMIGRRIKTRPQSLTTRNKRDEIEENKAPNKAKEKEAACFRLMDYLKNAAFKLFRPTFTAEPEGGAIVKVVCECLKPDSRHPWHKVPTSGISTGVIIDIDKKRILTCAHSVEYHTEVTLKKYTSNTEYEATVLAIAPECDLALLTVTDDEFWKGVRPLKLGNMPALKDNLIIAGFSYGGDRLDQKSCFLSHVNMFPFTCRPSSLLALQINVEAEGGTSGGPALDSRGNCVGILFSDAQMRGATYLVPIPVIKHFIQDYEKRAHIQVSVLSVSIISKQVSVIGFPIFAAKWQKMESRDMCTVMGTRSNQEGILIREAVPNYPEFEVLEPHDIILSIDGISIASDGTVPFIQGQRIDFGHLVMQKYVGDKITVEGLRNMEVHKFSINLPTHKQFVPNTKGRPLSYIHMAGFVFTTLSVSHLQYQLFSKYYGYLPENLMSIALHEERVVVCKVFKNDLNAGYEEDDLVNHQVLFFNDKPVHSLKSLVMMVESCNSEFLKFDFDNHQVVVLQTEKAKTTKSNFTQYHLDA